MKEKTIIQCERCFDVAYKPAKWRDVFQERTSEEAKASNDVGEFNTHTGLCPTCVKELEPSLF